MKYDEASYQRYKQYRYNRYRFEREQKMIPITIIVCAVTLTMLFKFILIAIGVTVAIALIGFSIYLYLKKQLKSTQPIALSKEDAEEGVQAKINVIYASKTVSFDFDIPAGVKHGQKFVAKNILFTNKKGKKVNKNVHFKVSIDD